ncbi:histidine kinase [Kocuria sp. APC 4018]|uniref:sensor histidine kinase n=1 Tax=Kocuria sp. APC 4018 TaxID=3035196 RepID=UPI0025B4FEF8|nr:histidine kinase [Kocuria sp. APC 4018]MDN3461552.1 histidine kinase [Kocuria sp. APC 4018]
MSTPTRTAPRPRTEEPEHDWSDLLFATVWLVFLVIPAAALLQSDESVWATALGLLGLVLFAGLYTVSWIRHILVPRLSVLGNAALWCVVLLVPLTLLLPASPWGMTYTAPFFVAVCAFRLPLRQGILAALLIELAALVPLLMLLPREQWFWPLFGLVLPGPIILLSRFAVERSETHERLARELEVSRQREAVGRDVHDILGHSLTVITVKTQLAQRLVETDPQRAVAELDDVLALSREALTDVRSTVGRLRDLDLGVELVQARAALRAAGITPHLPSSVPPLDAVTRSVFAWILREAVTNVVRHSGAAHCRVTLTGSSLRIADDGARAAGAPTHHSARTDTAARPGGGAPSTSRPRPDDAAADASYRNGVGPVGPDIQRPVRAGARGEAASSRSGPEASTGGGAAEPELREGNGIRGMKERAHAAGCEVTVARDPRGGTIVEVRRA